jgi:asparagine synthase (glutamine-hydrolysing)
MCGIVGIAAALGVAELEGQLARMNDAIIHRGPDDSGSHLAPGIGLAMRRLSIIDIAGGHQPMRTEDGVAIVFNGEIYNYLALRRDLQARGYVFRTQSDTEVILNLYHAEGVNGLRRLNGMFAVAIHDARSEELVLVRDQIGIKPLYYLRDSGRLLFASEIKAILAALPGRPPIDRQALWDYLSLGYVPPPRSIWQGILKLEPGHILRHDLTTRVSRLQRYWAPDLTPDPFDPGRDYAREFHDHFLAAVESHIVASDVPVGAFLSGGLDSGAICAASVELGHRKFHTFSITGEAAGDRDETGLARLVSRKFATTHHEIVMRRADFFDTLDQAAWHFDEPYGDETGIALLLLSRLARQHVKVAMSGEGSDEMLLGYATEADVRGQERIQRKYGGLPRALYRAAAPFFGGSRAAVLAALGKGGPGAYLKGLGMHISWALADEEKARFWRGPSERPTRALVSSWYTLPTTVDPMAQSQQAAFQTWLVEDLLMKSDKMSMAVSLESRVPFLHLPLVEWCQRAPMQARLGDVAAGEVRPKAILRDFVASRLPPEVLNAPKRGFSLPALAWSAERLREQGGFRPTSRAIHDMLDFTAMQPLVEAAMSGAPQSADKVWNVVMLDRWCRAYLD